MLFRSLEPPGPEVGPQVDFGMICKRPGGGCVYGFHTQNTSKTRRNARPLSGIFATQIVVFPSILASFPLPGAPLEPPGPEVGPKVDFGMIFKRPGGGFGSPLGPFGLPWPALGRPWASLWRPKWSQKCEKEQSRCAVRSRGQFSTKKGGARTLILR